MTDHQEASLPPELRPPLKPGSQPNLFALGALWLLMGAASGVLAGAIAHLPSRQQIGEYVALERAVLLYLWTAILFTVAVWLLLRRWWREAGRWCVTSALLMFFVGAPFTAEGLGLIPTPWSLAVAAAVAPPVLGVSLALSQVVAFRRRWMVDPRRVTVWLLVGALLAWVTSALSLAVARRGPALALPSLEQNLIVGAITGVLYAGVTGVVLMRMRLLEVAWETWPAIPRRWKLAWLTGAVLAPALIGLLGYAISLQYGGLAQTFRATGTSMRPTLEPGTKLLAYPKRPDEIRRGDLVVYTTAGQERFWIHRVVGLPGDVIEIQAGVVFVNGEALHEPYILEPPRYSYPFRRLGSDHFFILGDNRNNAADSHIRGPFPASDILGVVY